MMKKPISLRLRLIFSFLLAISCKPVFALQSDAYPEYLVAHNQVELDAFVAAGATPLDALTAFGRREFLRRLSWRDGKLVSFSPAAPLRELNLAQTTALFRFVGTLSYLPKEFPSYPALRVDDSTPRFENEVIEFEQFLSVEFDRKFAAGNSAITVETQGAKQAYHAQFSHYFLGRELKKLGSADLLLLFQVTRALLFYEVDETAFRNLEQVLNEFETRGFDTRRQLNGQLFDSMLRQNQYGAAREFGRLHIELDANRIPQIVDNLGSKFKGRSVLNYDEASKIWSRENVSNSGDLQVVMIVSEGCQFSKRALQEISSDFGLIKQLKQANLLVMTSPGDTSSHMFVRQWNEKHPEFPLRAPFDRAEWFDVSNGTVPVFLIFKNQQLIKTIKGWGEGAGDTAQLLAAIKTVM